MLLEAVEQVENQGISNFISTEIMKTFFTLSGNEEHDAFNNSAHEVLMQAVNDVEEEPQSDAGSVLCLFYLCFKTFQILK